MGCLWRASNSRLVSLVRATKSKTKLLRLKPSNIPSLTAWNAWVKSKNSSAFKVRSDQYRKLRKGRIPHTTSRKGMIGLSHELVRLWLEDILWDKKLDMDMYRCKAVLNIQNSDQLHILQAVREIYEIVPA